MPDPFQTLLHNWQSFYILTGTAAATLIGLMFVAVSLSTANLVKEHSYNVQIFVTPNLIHFGMVLIVSALTAIPTHTMLSCGVGLTLLGGVGLLWSVAVMWRMARHPVKGSFDPGHWLWHALIPSLAFAGIGGAGVGLLTGSTDLFNWMAYAIILLLIAAIRNTWDLALWIARNRQS